jgi:hypothetical protein
VHSSDERECAHKPTALETGGRDIRGRFQTGEWYYLAARDGQGAPNHINTARDTAGACGESDGGGALPCSVPAGSEIPTERMRRMLRSAVDHQRNIGPLPPPPSVNAAAIIRRRYRLREQESLHLRISATVPSLYTDGLVLIALL